MKKFYILILALAISPAASADMFDWVPKGYAKHEKQERYEYKKSETTDPFGASYVPRNAAGTTNERIDTHQERRATPIRTKATAQKPFVKVHKENKTQSRPYAKKSQAPKTLVNDYGETGQKLRLNNHTDRVESTHDNPFGAETATQNRYTTRAAAQQAQPMTEKAPALRTQSLEQRNVTKIERPKRHTAPAAVAVTPVKTTTTPSAAKTTAVDTPVEVIKDPEPNFVPARQQRLGTSRIKSVDIVFD